MKEFLGEDFLLETDTASRLYHHYAAHLPIIDYHNHLPPEEIANDKQFKTITEVWLKGDHYKWRAMRMNGVDEYFITGDASDREKFLKWAETVPYTLRNPLFHWTHLELKRYFGITGILSRDNAEHIYDHCNEMLASPEFSSCGLLKGQNVEVVCTTDNPTDDLQHHRSFAGSNSFKMLPTFRPDKFVNIEQDDFSIFLDLANLELKTYDALLNYLYTRIEYFASLGCKLSDHGLNHFSKALSSFVDLDAILLKRMEGGKLTTDEIETWKAHLLHDLATKYHEKGWVAQYHVGALRNNNSRLKKEIGADVGCDSIGDFSQGESMSLFLDKLNQESQLPKSILYNLNPRDNEVFATMIGNFRNLHWGSAWWFLDQKDGMEKQMNTLSNMSLLSKFIGMLTDSRSFLSFPRHEYFRRILCNLIGNDVTNGEIPHDMDLLGSMVQDICYFNAKNYFNF
jgi:glucuronate isomerase